MNTQIRVYGKSQSRTALGIINAYLKLHPDCSLSELRQAFPKSLNPKSFTDSILVPEHETKGQEKNFFEREDELVVLKNGERLALVELWTKEDFEAICEHAKQFGIEVAELESTKPFEKGSYELEYLQPFMPPVDDGKKKRKRCWLWILLLILLLLVLIICLLKCCDRDKSSISDVATAPALETSVSQTETTEPETDNAVIDAGDSISFRLPDGKFWKIGKMSAEYKLFHFLNSEDTKAGTSDAPKEWINLDKVRFESGKTKLTPEAEKQLESVAMVLKFFQKSHVKLGGFTDSSGSDEINKRLSVERAKAVAEKLIASGIEKNRITQEGFGAQYPVCPDNNSDDCKNANRRVSIRVTQK
jgi:outer membrane protein OmpA-like peptidoglycan-associated protein